MVAPQHRIASAFFLIHGQYGDVSRYARERDVCRQWVYREAAWVNQALSGSQQQLESLRARVRQLEERQTELQGRLANAVLLDEDKQAELASVGQACGVTLRDCRQLLKVLLADDKILSVATLGRRTQRAGVKAGQSLEVLDEFARQKVREARGRRNLCQRSGTDGGGTGEPVLDQRSQKRRSQQRSVGPGI